MKITIQELKRLIRSVISEGPWNAAGASWNRAKTKRYTPPVKMMTKPTQGLSTGTPQSKLAFVRTIPDGIVILVDNSIIYSDDNFCADYTTDFDGIFADPKLVALRAGEINDAINITGVTHIVDEAVFGDRKPHAVHDWIARM